MTTFDEVVGQSTIDFMAWPSRTTSRSSSGMNTTRAHVLTHLSPKYKAMRNAKSGWGEEDAGSGRQDYHVQHPSAPQQIQFTFVIKTAAVSTVRTKIDTKRRDRNVNG